MRLRGICYPTNATLRQLKRARDGQHPSGRKGPAVVSWVPAPYRAGTDAARSDPRALNDDAISSAPWHWDTAADEDALRAFAAYGGIPKEKVDEWLRTSAQSERHFRLLREESDDEGAAPRRIATARVPRINATGGGGGIDFANWTDNTGRCVAAGPADARPRLSDFAT